MAGSQSPELCEKYNQQFNEILAEFVMSLIPSSSNKKRKTGYKVIPLACNDL